MLGLQQLMWLELMEGLIPLYLMEHLQTHLLADNHGKVMLAVVVVMLMIYGTEAIIKEPGTPITIFVAGLANQLPVELMVQLTLFILIITMPQVALMVFFNLPQ